MWLCLMWMALGAQEATPAQEFETERLRQLMAVRRIYVEKLAGENADHIRDTVIAGLQDSKLFIVTEDAEKADAVLRGSTQYTAYLDSQQYGENMSARDSGRSSRYSGSSVSEGESGRSTTRRELASASLRLVNKDGDVIWSTTQESRGAKFKGAAADVAAKVARQLVDDYAKARKAQ